MAETSNISALVKIAQGAQTKTARRAQEDATLIAEEKEGRKRLLSNRRTLERQLEEELKGSRKRVKDEEQKKAQELATRQDEEMATLKQKHLQERVQLGDESKAALSRLMAIELARDSELDKEIKGKERALEATIQAKQEGLQAVREAEDENERATIQRHSTLLAQLNALSQPSQPVQTSSNTRSEFTTSPRAQDMPANNVDAQLRIGQLHEKKVDNNVNSEWPPRSVPVSPTSNDDRLARIELLIECNKRENEEVFGSYPTVTQGVKRPHVSEQSGATSKTPSNPVASESATSTLGCIVVEAVQTPKRRRVESPSNGGTVAATSPSPSTPTSTSKFVDAPKSNEIENTLGSASRLTVSTIRDALPTPSPTPSTPATPSSAGGRLNSKGYLDIPNKKYPPGSRPSQKVSTSPTNSSFSTSALPIPNKTYSVRHFRSTKPNDNCQSSFWSPTPRHQSLSIKWCGHKFEPLPVKGSNGELLPVLKEFTIEPGRVWKFEYSLTEALVHMKRQADDGQYAWVAFKDQVTLEAFMNEYKRRWPTKSLTKNSDLKLPD